MALVLALMMTMAQVLTMMPISLVLTLVMTMNPVLTITLVLMPK